MALEQIIAYKHELLRSKAASIEAMQAAITKSDRSLHTALSQKNAAFIFEIKPASPSKGVIRADADIVSIANIYAPFASAISVLADEKFFGGSLVNVRNVASTVACPVLAKDVVVSPLQIVEARAHGAHAVLLMLSVLDDETFHACAKTARDLGMDFITEVHSESEMVRANQFRSAIIGINNRNLKTLEIDMSTTERLAPMAHADAIVIAESGIATRGQIKKFESLVHGYLIGTALMKSARIDLALRELIFGRVKICGLTHRDDAVAAYNSGAYYGGLNFAPVSKRLVSCDDAAEIIRDVPLNFGGVFVNQRLDEVCDIATHLKLSFVQIHGDESDDYLKDLRKCLPPSTEIWRAFRVKDNRELQRSSSADRILLDAFHEKDYGGTGKSFDWSVLENCPREQFILAGGITPSTIALADRYAPFALDTASGVEDGDARKKSHEKIHQLFSQLRPRRCS